MDKKDLILLKYCVENNVSVLKNKDMVLLFGVTPRSISEWVGRGIPIPAGGKERITAHRLRPEFEELTERDLGVID